ncbi:hypothetical protein GGS24DRAFT_327748 [Hypoxylon argillaceum]|nr:hypothetical protein GGS24DRAFT_327748 [Hypoxylon argillaceum]
MATTRSATKNSSSASAAATTYAHAPSALTLVWLAVSLPLVAWDCGYVLMRPRTMPGGDLHWPLWTPYALYGEVDHVYGWKAFNAGSGFTGAQGLLNVLETLMYLYYAAAYLRNATSVSGRKVVVGRTAAVAVLVGFSAAVMTLSKTVLYWLCEYYSGFDNIGHNSLQDLIVLWIIPNGAWLIFPTIMIYELGSEMVENLAAGAGVKRD